MGEDRRMILEQRTYTLHPGKVQEFLGIVEEYGLPVHMDGEPSGMCRRTRKTGFRT